VKQTSKRKTSSASKRRVSTSKKATKRAPKRKPSGSRSRKRKPALSYFQIILILAGFAVLLAAVSFGILYFKGGERVCRSEKKAVSTAVLGVLFQEGLSRKEVSWHETGNLTVYTVQSETAMPRVYRRLKRRLHAQFPGTQVKRHPHRIVLLCGKRASHEILFVGPSAKMKYPPVVHIKQSRKKKAEAQTEPGVSPKILVPVKKAAKVRVAIVIDDIGNDRAMARKLMNLPAPITLSIFPFAPYALEIAKEAEARHYPIMMHMPMEPEGYPGKGKDPGAGALLVKMLPAELVRQIGLDLDRIPAVCGVNNHMGSRFTCDSEGMEVLIDELKKRNKFFLDSRTSSHTVGFDIARRRGVPTIRRDVFLDNTQDVQKIRQQLDILVEKARKHGYAVGIGHPHRATYLALKKATPELEKEGVTFVFVSSLVH